MHTVTKLSSNVFNKVIRDILYEEVDWNEGIYSFFSIAIIVHKQLACSVFSNLQKHGSAVSNLCSTQGANSCGEKFSFLKDNEKFVFQ